MATKKICGTPVGIVKRYYYVTVGAIREDWDGNICLLTPGGTYWPKSEEDRSDLRKDLGFYATFLVRKSDGSIKEGSFGITGVQHNYNTLQQDVDYIWETNFSEYFRP